MKKILFVNACVRKESRTRELAELVLSRLYGKIEEVNLEKEALKPLTRRTLNRRMKLQSENRLDDEMIRYAHQFRDADIIVMAAPYWDLSFPAALKQYIEQINAVGITFRYTESGEPQGLCRAKKLYYVTTAGGPIYSDAFGYGYIKSLAHTFYGIPETDIICAENLDLIGADTEILLQDAIRIIQESTGL